MNNLPLSITLQAEAVGKARKVFVNDVWRYDLISHPGGSWTLNRISFHPGYENLGSYIPVLEMANLDLDLMAQAIKNRTP